MGKILSCDRTQVDSSRAIVAVGADSVVASAAVLQGCLAERCQIADGAAVSRMIQNAEVPLWAWLGESDNGFDRGQGVD